MSRDSCDNTIAKFSLLFGKWFFSSKRYTTWADNIFLSRILEEEEEEHLPVVRRDLVLDESVDERADPLFTQALSRSRLSFSPPQLFSFEQPGYQARDFVSPVTWTIGLPETRFMCDQCDKVWVAIMWGRTNIAKRWRKSYLCNLQVCPRITCR